MALAAAGGLGSDLGDRPDLGDALTFNIKQDRLAL
jgi:hypothetical protein